MMYMVFEQIENQAATQHPGTHGLDLIWVSAVAGTFGL